MARVHCVKDRVNETADQSTKIYRGPGGSFVRRQLLLYDYYAEVLSQRVDLALTSATPSEASFRRLIRLLQLNLSPVDSSSTPGTPTQWRVKNPITGMGWEPGTIASLHQGFHDQARFQWHRLAHLRLAAVHYLAAPRDEQAQIQVWMDTPGHERAEQAWQLTFDALGIEALRTLPSLPKGWIAWHARRDIAIDRAAHMNWTDELAEKISEARAAALAAEVNRPSMPTTQRRL